MGDDLLIGTTGRPFPQHVLDMPHSGIRAIMELATDLGDCIHLEVGEPDFVTPEPIIEAACRAARAGFTHYTNSAGLLSLRTALVEKLWTRNRIVATPDDVVVVPGAVAAVYSSLAAIVSPGDEVLVPEPGWPNYVMQTIVLGATPVYYDLDPANGFQPDVTALRALITPRTRVLLINSPGNPTGGVYTAETMRAMAELAAEHRLVLLSDEIYEDITFDRPHVSPAALGVPGATIITVSGFSKSYAMTGWRLGYAVAPAPIAAMVKKLQEPIVSCASAISQKAGEAALALPRAVVEEMVASYRQRREAAMVIFRAHGITAHSPAGAFYLLVDIGEAALRSEDDGQAQDPYAFARALLREERVAVAPGHTFGPRSGHLIRIALCTRQADLEEGCRRICHFLERRGAHYGRRHAAQHA